MVKLSWRSSDGRPVTSPDPKNPIPMYATGMYRFFNGTSAATPYVSGVIALMMQKKPTLTVQEFKSLFQRNASTDSYTDSVPNADWGYGRLDLTAVRAILRSIRCERPDT